VCPSLLAHRLVVTSDACSISLEQILEKARVILEPYTLECPEITWWTI
jgi:hypothetical protein